MFELKWTPTAEQLYSELKQRAEISFANRKQRKQEKSSKIESLFKQVHKTVTFLKINPRHSGLHIPEFDSLEHPFDPKQKVFEAYVQNNTPAAFRVFWCYGPDQKQITVIAITAPPKSVS